MVRIHHIAHRSVHVRDFLEFAGALEGTTHRLYVWTRSAVWKDRVAPDSVTEFEVDDVEDSIRKGVADCDVVLIHYLHRESIRLLPLLPRNLVVVWIVWGKDFYSLAEESLIRSSLARLRRIRGSWREAAREVRRRASRTYSRRLLGRLDFIATPFDFEYAGLVRALPQVAHSRFIDIKYTLKPVVSLSADDSGPVRVMVGNSGDPSNRHFELLDWLEKAGLHAETKLWFPMSYGDSEYIRKVEQAARSAFSDRVEIQLEQLPQSDFLNRLSSCRHAVFNHRRQQGGWSIRALLALGRSVHLHPENTFYRGMREEGLVVGDVRDVPRLGLRRLSDDERAHNVARSRQVTSEYRERTKRALEQLAELSRCRGERF